MSVGWLVGWLVFGRLSSTACPLPDSYSLATAWEAGRASLQPGGEGLNLPLLLHQPVMTHHWPAMTHH